MFHPFDVLVVSLRQAVGAVCDVLTAVNDGIREASALPGALPPVFWHHPLIFGGLRFVVVPAAGLTGFCVLLSYLEARQISLRRDVRTSIVILAAGLLICGITG